MFDGNYPILIVPGHIGMASIKSTHLLAEMRDWDDWSSNYSPFVRALFNYTASTQKIVTSNEWITLNVIEKICKQAVVA